MTRWILGLVIAAGLSTAARVEAITVDEVKGLARAGANDSIILAKIEADSTVFNLTVDEILELREAGVSDRVITFMINTGKNAPQPVASDEEQAAPETTESQGGGGDYQTAPDNRYYGSVDISYGYYYPHWPGYSYTWYYDPFWWPSWSFYWAYWCPYPYYYWYPDPWYYGNYHYHDYYRHCYSPYYPDYGQWYDGPHRTSKGRNVGNRGPIDTAERILKVPSPGDQVRLGRTGGSYRLREPRPALAPSHPTVLRGGVRVPSQPRNPVVGNAPGRSRTVVRPAPQPAATGRVTPPSRSRVKGGNPAPANVGSQSRGNDSRDAGKVQTPPREEKRTERAEPSRAPTQREEKGQFQREERRSSPQSDRGGFRDSGRQGKSGSSRGGH